jgi:hypothetical protein
MANFILKTSGLQCRQPAHGSRKHCKDYAERGSIPKLPPKETEMKSKLSLALLAAIASTLVLAQPAPWYSWKSKLNGKTTCKQTSPGEGWVRDGGPFKDGNCKKPGTPGS